MSHRPYLDAPRGPFTADQLHDGDRYELSNGHPIYCAPAGKAHARGNLVGARVLGTDPDVTWAGVDAGFTPAAGELRAPDISVMPEADLIEGQEGWIPGAPPLAVEYAGIGQDEVELQQKIRELLAAGTRWVWVVRLTGTRRVEVYSPDAPRRVAGPGEHLEAPGVLRNPVLVEALFDPRAADEATLRNLLQRHGYDSLEAIRDEGKAEGERLGQARAILQLLEGRGLDVSDDQRTAILACQDDDRLKAWLMKATRAADAAELF